MQSIHACLWFDHQAEEAAKFYVSVFKNSRITAVSHYPPDTPSPPVQRPAGSVLTVAFELDGVRFLALNGGPQFTHSEAVSFVANCDTQEEIDTLWNKLCAGGGAPSACGWLKDKFGVSWQVVPREIEALLTSGDAARSQRVFDAIMGMGKLDLAALRRAAAG